MKEKKNRQKFEHNLPRPSEECVGVGQFVFYMHPPSPIIIIIKCIHNYYTYNLEVYRIVTHQYSMIVLLPRWLDHSHLGSLIEF